MGFDAGDDAAVWRRPDGRALVATADFFTPIVDDPHTWGRIAAANAASDVYAMGGSPLFALNLVAWPRDLLGLDILAEVLAGGASMAAEGGWVIAGGHTIDGPEPLYGQSVTGEVDPEAMMTNDAAAPGQVLILTKPLGTGLVATAVKRLEPADTAPGGRHGAAAATAVVEMTRLNATAAQIARQAGVRAATDVTGFGLLGHLLEVARASGVGAVIEAASVPVIDGVDAILAEGHVPGGTIRNLDHVRAHLEGAAGLDSGAGPDGEATHDPTLTVLADAQTSGGLLLACPPAAVDAALARLADTGHQAAAVGEVVADHPGRIRVT